MTDTHPPITDERGHELIPDGAGIDVLWADLVDHLMPGCDRCGAKHKTEWALGTHTLRFCGNHSRTYAKALGAAGWTRATVHIEVTHKRPER